MGGGRVLCSKCAWIMETAAVTELQDAVKLAVMVEFHPVGYSSLILGLEPPFWNRE